MHLQIFLGCYYNEELAARAYDLASIALRGQAACTNFPAEQYAAELAASPQQACAALMPSLWLSHPDHYPWASLFEPGNRSTASHAAIPSSPPPSRPPRRLRPWPQPCASRRKRWGARPPRPLLCSPGSWR